MFLLYLCLNKQINHVWCYLLICQLLFCNILLSILLTVFEKLHKLLQLFLSIEIFMTFLWRKLNLLPQICPAAADTRYLRKLGIPAIGFSPMNNTRVLMHADDEYLNVTTFLNGINIYRDLISAVANVWCKII